jgi:hypothetical protein
MELKNGVAEFLAWAEKIQAECARDCPGDPEAAERLCESRLKEHPDFAARYLPLLKAVAGRAYEAVMVRPRAAHRGGGRARRRRG